MTQPSVMKPLLTTNLNSSSTTNMTAANTTTYKYVITKTNYDWICVTHSWLQSRSSSLSNSSRLHSFAQSYNSLFELPESLVLFAAILTMHAYVSFITQMQHPQAHIIRLAPYFHDRLLITVCNPNKYLVTFKALSSECCFPSSLPTN